MAKAVSTKFKTTDYRLSRRNLVGLAVVLLALYVLLPQLGKFKISFAALEHSSFGWLAAAMLMMAATAFLAAAVYQFLAKKPLNFSRTVEVQVASWFVNRLLPVGAGALGLNYDYLRHAGHDRQAAGAVVAANNLIGFAGHTLLLGTVLATTGGSFSQLAWPQLSQAAYWALLVVVIVVVIILMWFQRLRDKLLRTVLGAFKKILNYRAHPLKLIGALVASIGLTSLYTLCLLACCLALGSDLSFGQCLVVLTVGVAGGTAVPTPGGLIGAEAGLFAGLVAYHLSDEKALAIALTFRFITYWLALAVGALSWIYVRRRRYV